MEKERYHRDGVLLAVGMLTTANLTVTSTATTSGIELLGGYER